MQFAYDGFQQDGDTRSFVFRGMDGRDAAGVFAIGIDLRLLAKYRLPVQDAPSFCLRLLTSASLEGPDTLSRLRSYTVLGEDLQPLLSEREHKLAEKNARKSYRKPFPKPPVRSNLYLGQPTGLPHSSRPPEAK